MGAGQGAARGSAGVIKDIRPGAAVLAGQDRVLDDVAALRGVPQLRATVGTVHPLL